MSSKININAVISDLELNNASIKASDNLMDVFNIFDKDRKI